MFPIDAILFHYAQLVFYNLVKEQKFTLILLMPNLYKQHSRVTPLKQPTLILNA